MALNGTGIEFGKSENDSRRRMSRATTTSADFILFGQRCGVQVQVVHQKVGHTRPAWALHGFTRRAAGAQATNQQSFSTTAVRTPLHLIAAGRQTQIDRHGVGTLLSFAQLILHEAREVYTACSLFQHAIMQLVSLPKSRLETMPVA
jgi:hypothetical protein